MRVFITGATGQIGSQLVKELVAAGHDVTGLARSESGAEKLKQWGAKPHMGDLNDINSLISGVHDADATVHLGFIHDFSNWGESLDTDIAAVKAMLDVSKDKVFVGTTGLLSIKISGTIGKESDPTETEGFGGKRGQCEQMICSASQSGVKAAVIRLAPTVHFIEDIGFVPSLVQIARRTGVSAYPNDGQTHWPAVHRDDAARLYKVVVEKLFDGTLQSGLSFHGVGESAIASKDIAQNIADKLQLGEAVSRPNEHFGFLGSVFSRDLAVSNDVTRKLTGWQPTGPTLLETIREPDFVPASLKTMV